MTHPGPTTRGLGLPGPGLRHFAAPRQGGVVRYFSGVVRRGGDKTLPGPPAVQDFAAPRQGGVVRYFSGVVRRPGDLALRGLALRVPGYLALRGLALRVPGYLALRVPRGPGNMNGGYCNFPHPPGRPGPRPSRAGPSADRRRTPRTRPVQVFAAPRPGLRPTGGPSRSVSRGRHSPSK